jgi:hypothetical protein
MVQKAFQAISLARTSAIVRKEGRHIVIPRITPETRNCALNHMNISRPHYIHDGPCKYLKAPGMFSVIRINFISQTEISGFTVENFVCSPSRSQT